VFTHLFLKKLFALIIYIHTFVAMTGENGLVQTLFNLV